MKNKVASALLLIAILIFIGGFALSFFHGYKMVAYGQAFNPVPLFITWGTTLIFGMGFLGFVQVIELLEKISRNTECDKQK